MDQFIKVNGISKVVKEKDEVFKFGEMELNILAFGKMTKLTAKVD